MRFLLLGSIFGFSTAALTLWSVDQRPLSSGDFSNAVANIPSLGFGTWNLRADHENATKAVEAAIMTGYRHIDCAAAYNNEKAVGAGIRSGLRSANLSRSDIWVTSKLWNTHHEASAVAEAAEKTLLDLGIGYLDLYLMHWPVAQSSSGTNAISYLDAWLAMGSLLHTDRVRHIGVSNFSPAQMRNLLANGGEKPYVHQMEMHPYLPQTEWLLWHASKGIRVTAYSPLGNMNPTYDGKKNAPKTLLQNERVQKIAKGAGCTPAQAVLQWGMARGVSVIPKSQHVKYIKENYGAAECELRYEDFEAFEKIGQDPFRFNNPSEAWGVDLYDGLQGV